MLEGRNLEADWVMGQITFLNQDFRYYMLYRVIINMNNLENGDVPETSYRHAQTAEGIWIFAICERTTKTRLPLDI